MKKQVGVAIIAGVLITLNFLTFLSAYPQMYGYEVNKARDFSAYYIAAWRLVNDPSTVYHGGTVSGQYPIYPKPATFKYPPFFLLFIVPLLAASYQSGIVVFNIIQFSMLPVIALLIYKTMAWRKRSIVAMAPVMVLALLAPFAAPNVLFQDYRVRLVQNFLATGSVLRLLDGFSNAYYWQWVEGNARVLEMLLFFLSLYLATKRSPISGVAFGLSALDPRMALLSLPIVLLFNRASSNLSRFFNGLIVVLMVNFPLALYSNIGQQFVVEALRSGPFDLYAYEWIPIYSIVAFTVLNLDLLVPRLSTILGRKEDAAVQT
jgi:hypothetical protein